MSHFHSAKVAEKMDRQIIDAVADMKVNKLDKLITSGEAEACGFGSVETGLLLAEKFEINNVEILDYTHSGMIIGDNSSVVGYLSGVLYK